MQQQFQEIEVSKTNEAFALSMKSISKVPLDKKTLPDDLNKLKVDIMSLNSKNLISHYKELLGSFLKDEIEGDLDNQIADLNRFSDDKKNVLINFVETLYHEISKTRRPPDMKSFSGKNKTTKGVLQELFSKLKLKKAADVTVSAVEGIVKEEYLDEERVQQLKTIALMFEHMISLTKIMSREERAKSIKLIDKWELNTICKNKIKELPEQTLDESDVIDGFVYWLKNIRYNEVFLISERQVFKNEFFGPIAPLREGARVLVVRLVCHLKHKLKKDIESLNSKSKEEDIKSLNSKSKEEDIESLNSKSKEEDIKSLNSEPSRVKTDSTLGDCITDAYLRLFVLFN